MFFCPFSQCQRDKLRSVIHAKHGRIAAILSSTRTTRGAGRFRSISIDNASRLKSSTTLNVRKRRPQTKASFIKSTDQLWFSTSGVASGEGLRTGSRCLPLRRKFSFSRKSNTVDPFVIPLVSLPPQNLEKLRKTVSRVSFSRCLQCGNNGFVTRRIRAVMVNRSAQVQTPAGLADTESECRYQMSDQLTLRGWF